MIDFFRTENIAEDEKYYKSISGLHDRTGEDVIEHGNSSPRKCKLTLFYKCMYYLYYLSFMYPNVLVSSKEFWEQVEVDKIHELSKEYAYKHDFELFGYSIKEYLSKIGYSESDMEMTPRRK